MNSALRGEPSYLVFGLPNTSSDSARKAFPFDLSLGASMARKKAP